VATIQCWVEHLEGNQWELQNPPSPFTTGGLQIPRDTALYGLLAMGVVNPGYPFSWGLRGLPPVLSEDLAGIYGRWRAANVYPSYLTRKELLEKAAELLIYPHDDALRVRPPLLDLIQHLPEHHGDPRDQRIVFWFAP
jgi:hypothetical protein